jgi:uncharacterized alpha/beta hydrolase family protein
MKKALLILFVLLISAAFVTAVFAQDQPTAGAAKLAATAEKKAPAKPKTHEYTGTVASMDAAAKMLVIKGKKGEMTFDVAGSKWKGYKAMDEVKAGQKVTVKYMEKDGKMMATAVAKSTAGTKKK